MGLCIETGFLLADLNVTLETAIQRAIRPAGTNAELMDRIADLTNELAETKRQAAERVDALTHEVARRRGTRRVCDA